MCSRFGTRGFWIWSIWKFSSFQSLVVSKILSMTFEGCFLAFMAWLSIVGNLYGRSWGFIRGLWDGPWYVGGDFNMIR